MNEVIAYLQQNPTFYLATIDGDQPRVRPFGAICAFEGKLYLITNNQKDVYKQLQDNPKAELCTADAQGGWLRVAATLVEDDRPAPREAMLEANPSLRAMYSADDGRMAVLYLKDATATFASFTAAPRTVQF